VTKDDLVANATATPQNSRHVSRELERRCSFDVHRHDLRSNVSAPGLKDNHDSCTCGCSVLHLCKHPAEVDVDDAARQCEGAGASESVSNSARLNVPAVPLHQDVPVVSVFDLRRISKRTTTAADPAAAAAAAPTESAATTAHTCNRKQIMLYAAMLLTNFCCAVLNVELRTALKFALPNNLKWQNSVQFSTIVPSPLSSAMQHPLHITCR
jgi:hypothetical protein